MALDFSSATLTELKAIVARYPNAMAACLPALHLAQRDFGTLSQDVVDLVARTLSLSPAHVWGVATFYTMYNKKPVATYHLQVCTNVSCMLHGGYELLRLCQAAASEYPKLFSVSEVECLAACGTAVCIQVNDDYHERMDVEKTRELIAKLTAGAQ